MQRFLQTLDEACQKTGWQVHAFCLMSNHFHLEALAMEIRANTTMPLTWIANRLKMGSRGYLTWLLCRVKPQAGKAIWQYHGPTYFSRGVGFNGTTNLGFAQ